MNKTLKDLLRKIDDKEARYSPLLLLVRRDEFRGRIILLKREKMTEEIIKKLRSKTS